jgi:hypothetical protein
MDATLVATSLGAVGTLVAVYVGGRALYPAKRALAITVFPAAPLLSAPNVTEAGVRVIRNGQELADPHISTVTVVNTGRHDVTDDTFHDRMPIVVDLGARVVDVVHVTSKPERLTTMPCRADGSTVRLGPGLLSTDQELLVQVLTEGAPARNGVRHELIDVRVTVGPPRSAAVPWTVVAAVGVSLAGALAGNLIAGATLARGPAPAVRTAGIGVSNPVARGDDFGVLGSDLADYCPVEVVMFGRPVARAQTNEHGFFYASVHVAKTAQLGKTDVEVTCRDQGVTSTYHATVAIVAEPRPSGSATASP